MGKILLFLLLVAGPAGACPVCRPRVQAAVYGPHYLATALLVLLPVLLLAGGGVALYFAPRLAAGNLFLRLCKLPWLPLQPRTARR